MVQPNVFQPESCVVNERRLKLNIKTANNYTFLNSWCLTFLTLHLGCTISRAWSTSSKAVGLSWDNFP